MFERKRRKHRLKNKPARLIVEVVGQEYDDDWYFRIKSPNGRILCHSEGYVRRRDCIGAVDRIMGCDSFTLKPADGIAGEPSN